MTPPDPCLHRSIYGENILFRMVKHEDSVELIVERDVADGCAARNAIASSSVLLVTGFILSSLLSIQEISNHMSVAFTLIIIYWSTNAFLTVTSERIQIFHFAHGLQYSRYYRFGLRKVVFTHSQRVILNEVVSMQRIIVFLSCLIGPADRLRGENRSNFEVVPLFTHLHPRQKLLKVIYNHLLDAFKKKDAVVTLSNNHQTTSESPANHKSLDKSASREKQSLILTKSRI